jgi:uncharacterized membrane protein
MYTSCTKDSLVQYSFLISLTYSDSFETSQVVLIVGIVFLYTTGVVMFLRNVCGYSAVFNLKTLF